MKTFLLPALIIIILGSCHQKTEQEKLQDATAEAQHKTDSIAAPFIANDIGDIDIALTQIADTTQSINVRRAVLQQLVNRFSEYINYQDYYTLPADCEKYLHPKNIKSVANMDLNKYSQCSVISNRMAVDSTASERFKEKVRLEKEYVKAKWKNYAAQIVYKQALLKQQQAQDALDELKK